MRANWRAASRRGPGSAPRPRRSGPAGVRAGRGRRRGWRRRGAVQRRLVQRRPAAGRSPARATFGWSLTTMPQTRWRPARVISCDLRGFSRKPSSRTIASTARRTPGGARRAGGGRPRARCRRRSASSARPRSVGEAGQAAVEPVGAQVRERRRGGRALRQVRRRQPPAEAVVGRDGAGSAGRGAAAHSAAGHDVRDEPGEVGGDRLGIAGRPEHAVHAAGRRSRRRSPRGRSAARPPGRCGGGRG